jgi:integrase
MAQVIPLFGAKPEVNPVNFIPAPEPTNAPAPANQTAETEQVSLHDGDLVVYRRPGASSKWQYRLRLPGGDYERKTTGKRALDDAKKVAEARYQEVRWREQRGLSTKATPFTSAAEAYIAHRMREADQAPPAKRDARMKKAGMERSMIRRYLAPHFGEVPLDEVDAQAVEGFHEAYFAQWNEGQGAKRVQFRRRDNKGREYKKPLAVQMPGTHIRKPGVNSRILFERLVRHIFERAVKDGRITRAEMPELDATKFVRNRRGAFSASEQKKLLAHLENRIEKTKKKHHQASRRLLWLWVRFHLLTGLRPGVEGTTLRFRDVEFIGGMTPHYVVRVHQGKTGARPVVVDMRLKGVINSIEAQHPDPKPDACLWVKPNGEPTTRFGEGLKAVLRELGLDRDGHGLVRTPYSMRHSFITDAIQRGVNLSMLADNAGNSVEQISAHYDHVIHTQHAAELLKGIMGRSGNS